MNALKVLVVDDDSVIRASLCMLIDAEPGLHLVADCANGHDAVALSALHRPDVILMDIQMPEMDGVTATRAICAGRGPRGAGAVPLPQVVVLTMFGRDEYVVDALQAGASGFLLKNAPPAEIVRAVRAAYAGNALIDPAVTRGLIERLTPAPTTSGVSGAERRSDDTHRDASAAVALLTDRERATLVLIARGLSNPEIADVLAVTRTTVRTYVSRILAKVSARDRTQLVVLAYESGLAGNRAARS